MGDPIAMLKAAIATSATGFAAIIDGAMDIRTIGGTKNSAAFAVLTVKSRRMVISTCSDPGCDCLVKVLAENYPDVRIVAVSVQVAHG